MFQGKFELRVWLGALILAVIFILAVISDQVTFVRSPCNQAEILLTLVPMLLFQIVPDRLSCFVLDMAIYGGSLGGSVLYLVGVLERYLFEPMFFKKMIHAKLREEELFNKYLDQSRL